MIKVTFKENEFNIIGHADYSEKGTDIVCAAVSFLSLVVANSMMQHGYTTFTSTADGEMIIKFKGKKVKIQYEMLKVGLEKLEQEYPAYIEITYN
jgi:uncharacterized protein YsxB (DUF464 family)